MLQRGERMLERFDSDLVDWLMETFEAMGVRVETGWPSRKSRRWRADTECAPRAAGGSSPSRRISSCPPPARAPALEGLDLSVAGVTVKDRRIEIDEYLRSVSHPAVYVAGDAAQAGAPLTSVAGRDGRAVAANLLHGPRHKANYTAVRRVAFALPPIAAVALLENEARAADLEVPRQLSQSLRLVYRAPGRAVRLRLQGAHRRAYEPHPGHASAGSACRGSHQPVRGRHALWSDCLAASRYDVRLSDGGFGPQLYALNPPIAQLGRYSAVIGR